MTMQTTQLPTSNPAAQAVVDLDAIQHNVRLLREHAGSAQVMVVLKADGYGHGATQVARAALAAGAAELGVATLDEALAIRRDGVTAPLLAWLHAPGTDFAPALTADVQLAVSSARQLRDLLDAVARTGRTATVTVKVDSGLSRNGASSAEFAAMLPVLARARADDAVRLRGIMSHLACGDDPDSPVNDLQAQRFSEFRVQARDAGVEFEIAHLCNSPAAMTRPDLAYDMVRPGIAVYGQTPIATRGDMGLIPAMTLKCRCRAHPFDQGGRWRLLRSHLDRGPGHHGGAAADRVRRRCLPLPQRAHRRRDQRTAAPQRRTHLHGPVRRRPRPGIRRRRRG